MGRDRRNEQPKEHWTKMLRQTMEEPAWRALSPMAQALYPWLKFEWRGPQANNNGKIRLSVRQAADRIGCSINAAARAFHELQAKGFITVRENACLGIDGAAKSPAYELTELKMPGSEAKDGSKLYRQWREGQDFSIVKAVTNNPSGRNGGKTESRHQNEDGTVIKLVTKRQSTSSK